MTWEERNLGVKIIYNQRDGSTVCCTVSLTKPTANNLLSSVTEIMIDPTDFLYYFVMFAKSILIPCVSNALNLHTGSKTEARDSARWIETKKLRKLNIQITYAF